MIDTGIRNEKLHCNHFQRVIFGQQESRENTITHGTLCAEIFDACTEDYELINFQVLPDGTGAEKTWGYIADLKEAMQKCLEFTPDIICMSAVTSRLSDSQELYEISKKLSEQALIVAALDNRQFITVPASYPFVAGVQSDREGRLLPGEVAWYEADNYYANIYANCRLPVLQKYGCSPSNSLAVPVVAAYIHNMLRRGCNLQEAVRALKPYPAQSRKKTDDGIPFAEKEREVPVVLLVDGDVRRGTLFCEIILDQLLEKYGIEATALTSEMSERYDIRVRVFLSTLQIADDVYFMQTHYKTDLIFIVADVYEYSDICRRLESDLKVFIEDRRVKMTTDESSVILGREQVADAIYYALT